MIAVRHGSEVEYHDCALRTFTKYVPAERTVYRLPEDTERMSQDLGFYRQLLDPQGPTKSPIPGMEVVAQSRRDVVEGGRTWVDIELTLRVVAGDREQRMRFRVDPVTKLPHSIVFQSVEGSGGNDPLRLPRPRARPTSTTWAPREPPRSSTASPGDDLDRVLAGLKAGRVRFDDYRAIVAWGSEKSVHERQARLAQGAEVAGRAVAPRPQELAPSPTRPTRLVEGAPGRLRVRGAGDLRRREESGTID